MDENEQIHEKLVRHISVEQDLGHGKQYQTVQYIDYETPENNDFFALNQFRVAGPVEVVKPDVVLFVNGVPLGVVECKSPQIKEPRSEALDQLTRYQNERDGEAEGAEELFRYNQFSVATWMEGAVMGTYRTPKDQYKPWRDAYPLEDDELIELFDLDGYLPDQYRMLYALFEPERLLDQLRHYTVFEERQSGTIKMVARYQQYRAVRKALERIDKRSQREAQGGVVWHTQGSGKSLTMLFLALKLRRLEDDPTLVLVTDRRALNDQIHATFQRCGFPNPKKAQSIEDLRERLSYDAGETITTLIHKFQTTDDDGGGIPGALPEREHLRDGRRGPPDAGQRSSRATCGRRSRTPSTSASPGRPSRRTAATPGARSATTSTRTPSTNRSRMARRSKSCTRAGWPTSTSRARRSTAFSTGSSRTRRTRRRRRSRSGTPARRTSRRRRRALTASPWTSSSTSRTRSRRRSRGWSSPPARRRRSGTRRPSTVLTGRSRASSSPRVTTIRNTSSGGRPATQKSQYKESFVDPNGEVELLIVCDMLLTGFDAPVAQVMYLDKPLREHSLLQAIARVNRPFEEKTHGLVIDYYGVSDELKEALAMFSSKDVERAMVPVEDKQPELEAAHSKAVSFFEDLDDVERCVQSLEPDDRRIEFKNAFKRFSQLMDIVLPDPIANPYRGTWTASVRSTARRRSGTATGR